MLIEFRMGFRSFTIEMDSVPQTGDILHYGDFSFLVAAMAWAQADRRSATLWLEPHVVAADDPRRQRTPTTLNGLEDVPRVGELVKLTGEVERFTRITSVEWFINPPDGRVPYVHLYTEPVTRMDPGIARVMRNGDRFRRNYRAAGVVFGDQLAP